MDSSRTGLCAILITALTGPALAATHWLCSISSDSTRLICVADREPLADVPTDTPATTAVVNGTRLPLDAARLYTIDMWSPSTDPEFVALLARSAVCYRSPGCEVSMAPSPWLQALARR